jgi:putative transposase
MVLYRRSRLAGQSYFFTLGLQDRSTSTLTDHISLLGLAIRAARARRPF